MNKNRLTGILLIAFFMMMFFSCKKSNKKTGDSIVFDSVIVARQIPLLETNDTTLPFSDVEIKFTYPIKFGNVEDLESLQKIFIGTFFNDLQYDSLTPQEAVESYLKNYTEEYKSLSNNFYSDKQRLPEGETPVWYWYQLINTNKILFRNDSLLSYAVEYYDYTGGAHGSYRIMYFNIDLDNIVTISEEDVFVPNYHKTLTDKLVSQLMKQHDVTSTDSLLTLGYFNIEDIIPNNNFWIDNEGLHYSFNQYEIAPYSMGVIDITIPYSEISEILLPKGIISRYILNKQ